MANLFSSKTKISTKFCSENQARNLSIPGSESTGLNPCDKNRARSNSELPDLAAAIEKLNFSEKIPELNPFPLDAKELFRLKSSWRAVHRQITEAGVELFLKYVCMN